MTLQRLVQKGLVLAACALSTILPTLQPASAQTLILTEREISELVLHGPWPRPQTLDPSNRLSGRPEAIEFGRILFFDKRLSSSGTVSCASCHRPELGWTDGLPRGRGLAEVDRNTPPLLDIARQRWYGWDGRSDSLWAHSLGPILDPREMGADAGYVARLVGADPDLLKAYRQAFGQDANISTPESLLVDIAKALAAFQETITSGRTGFDDFRDALDRGDRVTAARFPIEAQRGAALFVGRGKCNFCHVGPSFTNGEFADIGVPFFIAPGRVDPGRQGGILLLKSSPYNQLGRFNDDPGKLDAWATRHVAEVHSNFGSFKVPTLRNLTQTAPYMHNGSKASLADVIRHYSEINLERLHADGERILEPLHLSESEIADLVAFLRSLSKN
ncbi:MauG Cytochrome c peroxidase [Rhabdaerophilaceae bacterium]